MTTPGDHLRQQIPLLQTTPAHYLDNAATALMPAAVLQAMRDYDAANRGNIGRGVHHFAEAADAAYAAARHDVAAALSASPEDIIFTAGCTAGLSHLAQAIGSTLAAGDTVLLSLAEHHSNIVPWQIAAAQHGFTLRYAAPDAAAADGAALFDMMDKHQPRVIAIAHTTNVGGSDADLAAIAAAKPPGALLIADGAQHIPHHLPNLPASGADFYAFSAHKCYGPNGIGVLWGRRDHLRDLPPITGGGGAISRVSTDGHTPAPLPQRLEPGTPPITPAVGLAAALRWRQQWPENTAAHTAQLADDLRDGLARLPPLRLLYPRERGTPIVSFTIDGAHSHDICEVFAARRVAIRGGHHCAEPLMTHLGIDGCARASLAPYNTAADITAAINAAEEACRLLR